MAVDAGASSNEPSFAFMAGLGDAIGVFSGNLLLSLLPRYLIFGEGVAMGTVKGGWLAFAALSSGTLWQPVLNMTHALGFTLTALITGLFCAAGFFSLLRLGRDLGSIALQLQALNGSDLRSLQVDMSIALAVAGGAFLFCATDGSLENNWASVFVVSDGTSRPVGMALAGASSACGFLAVQLLMNLVVPDGLLWLDRPTEDEAKGVDEEAPDPPVNQN